MKRLALALAILALAVVACGGGSSKSSSSPSEEAWYACTTLIDRQLGLSIMDAQDFAASRVTSSGNEFRALVYYASNATEYECIVERLSGGDWKLVSLSEN